MDLQVEKIQNQLETNLYFQIAQRTSEKNIVEVKRATRAINLNLHVKLYLLKVINIYECSAYICSNVTLKRRQLVPSSIEETPYAREQAKTTDVAQFKSDSPHKNNKKIFNFIFLSPQLIIFVDIISKTNKTRCKYMRFTV